MKWLVKSHGIEHLDDKVTHSNKITISTLFFWFSGRNSNLPINFMHEHVLRNGSPVPRTHMKFAKAQAGVVKQTMITIKLKRILRITYVRAEFIMQPPRPRLISAT